MKKKLRITPRTIEKLNQWKKDINSGKYRPYLTIRDVNKVGRRHWVFCPHQNRHVHSLSDGEQRSYTTCLWQPGRIEVFEQYALDVDDTLNIADDMGVIHPHDYRTWQAYVMTTDFVVRQKIDGKLITTAFTFKYWKQIYEIDDNGQRRRIKPRTWQKFDIERRYWAARGVEYRVITEKVCTKELYWNLKFCEKSAYLKVDPALFSQFVASFYQVWRSKCNLALDVICKQASDHCSLPFYLAIPYFQYAALYRYIVLSNTECIRSFRRIELLPPLSMEVK